MLKLYLFICPNHSLMIKLWPVLLNAYIDEEVPDLHRAEKVASKEAARRQEKTSRLDQPISLTRSQEFDQSHS